MFVKKSNHTEIFAAAQKLRQITDGKVSYINTDGHILDIIDDCIKVPPELDRREKSICVRKALNNPALLDITNEKDLVREIKIEFQRMANKPKEDYYTVIGLNFDPLEMFISSKKRAVYFNTNPRGRFFTKAMEGRRNIRTTNGEDHMLEWFGISKEEPLYFVTIKTSARTAFSAYDIAVEEMNFQRGLCNYIINSGKIVRTSWPPRPVNVFLEHPLVTVHQSDGSLATDVFWYRPDYRASPKTHISKNEISKVITKLPALRKTVNSGHLANDARFMIGQYNIAFDCWRYDECFLKIWALLEDLTMSGGKYDQLVSRVSATFEDRPLATALLHNLKNVRNDVTHSVNAEKQINEGAIYTAKHFAEQILRYYIYNSRKFNNRDQLMRYLDVCREKEKLTEDLKIMSIVKKELKP